VFICVKTSSPLSYRPIISNAVTPTIIGSCAPASRHIRLNTELAKKPGDCLEYIVLHEMMHLLEPTHNARFIALMDRFMPRWRFYRQVLNQLPVRHEHWEY
jgi:predicted metal-dependent hydrolase